VEQFIEHFNLNKVIEKQGLLKSKIANLLIEIKSQQKSYT